MTQALGNRPIHRQLLPDSLLIAACLVAVRGAGAVKVIMIAGAFGASDALDAYLVASLLPLALSEILAGSLATALIPAFVEIRDRHGRLAMGRFIARVAAGALIALGLGTAVLLVSSPFTLPIVSSGFSAEKRRLAQHLLYFTAPMIPLAGLGVVWRAALNTEERFALPAFATGFTPVITIGVLAWRGSDATVWSLVGATTAGQCVELICLGIAIHYQRLLLIPRWLGWDAALRNVVSQHLPLIAVAAIASGNLVVDQAMAAALGPGSVAKLNYGSNLYTVLLGIGGVALGTAALPQLSKLAAMSDRRGVRELVGGYLQWAALVVLPTTLLVVAISPFLVRILFLRGAFTTETAEAVTSIQRLSLLALPASMGVALLVRVISSLKANRILVRIAVGALILNTAGDYLLLQQFGLYGIPMAKALVQILTFIYLGKAVWHRVRP